MVTPATPSATAPPNEAPHPLDLQGLPPAAARPAASRWARLLSVLRGLWWSLKPARFQHGLPTREKLARRISRRMARRARFQRVEQRLEQRVGKLADRVQDWVGNVRPPSLRHSRPARAGRHAAAVVGSHASGLSERSSVAPGNPALPATGTTPECMLLERYLALSGRHRAALYAGNQVDLLVDGPDAFEGMFSAIEGARHSIFLESYIIEDAAIAQRLSATLLRKRGEGVTAHVLYDAIGSLSTADAFFDRLAEGGVVVCAFNPVNPLTNAGWLARYRARRSVRHAITHRDHRKILVVDGRIAFTGGINISEVYSSGSFGRVHMSPRPPVSSREGWRDTQVRIEGPAALALEKLVREAWVSQGVGALLPPEQAGVSADPAAGADGARASVAPAAGADGAGALTTQPPADKLVAIVTASPQDRENRIYAALLSAIDGAEHTVHLTMAYFAPGQEMVDALCDAARRGVRVAMVLPSLSDFAPVLHAGRSYYTALLTAGVQVHELQHAVLHAKTAVIDGVFSTVGSSNMDWRSFTGNNEVNAIISGADFGAEMEAMFAHDVAASHPVELSTWRQRPWLQRVKERAARALEVWW